MAAPSSEERWLNDDCDLDREYTLLKKYPTVEDFYSLLGLARDPPPTDSQIQTAYHNLSLSLHPDKQPPHLAEAANAQFKRIQEAYTTLIDPKKRIVYDIAGREAVQYEWGTRGAMAAKMESDDTTSGPLGPRAMSPTEFRRWFLARMKAKERQSLDKLVAARASLSITLDASAMMSPGEKDGEILIDFPPPTHVRRFVLGYTFKVALPDFSFARAWLPTSRTEREDESSLDDKKPEVQAETGPEVTIHASVNGGVRYFKNTVDVVNPNGTKGKIQIDNTPLINGGLFNLNASLKHNFQATQPQLQRKSRSTLRSLLDGALCGGTLQIFPTRELNLHLEKPIYPFPNGKPFTVVVQGQIPSNPSHYMPNIVTSITRPFGPRRFGALIYSTGPYRKWPSLIQGILSSFGLTLDPRLDALYSNQDSLQLQFISTSSTFTAEQAEMLNLPKSNPHETWQWTASASPAGGAINLVYGRNFFANQMEDIPRSEWNLDGYHPALPLSDHRGIRVEVETTLTLGGGFVWDVSAHRRVGQFSSMAFGVGLRDARGLIMTVSWRRLGQSIRLPVMVCPFDLVDAEISTLAVLAPCLVYLGIEFGLVRPQERRRRREAIVRKRKQLKSQIPVRRKESAQQIEMMSESTKRRQAREREKGGLFVEKAEYGYIPSKSSKSVRGEVAEPTIIDVTIPVAAQVEKSQLLISKNTIRFQIMGFYDPAPLLPKTLKIWYTFRGQHHYVEAKDGEDIACPRREHLLNAED